jgi:hypothetical protein
MRVKRDIAAHLYRRSFLQIPPTNTLGKGHLPCLIDVMVNNDNYEKLWIFIAC